MSPCFGEMRYAVWAHCADLRGSTGPLVLWDCGEKSSDATGVFRFASHLSFLDILVPSPLPLGLTPAVRAFGVSRVSDPLSPLGDPMRVP